MCDTALCVSLETVEVLPPKLQAPEMTTKGVPLSSATPGRGAGGGGVAVPDRKKLVSAHSCRAVNVRGPSSEASTFPFGLRATAGLFEAVEGAEEDFLRCSRRWKPEDSWNCTRATVEVDWDLGAACPVGSGDTAGLTGGVGVVLGSGCLSVLASVGSPVRFGVPGRPCAGAADVGGIEAPDEAAATGLDASAAVTAPAPCSRFT